MLWNLDKLTFKHVNMWGCYHKHVRIFHTRVQCCIDCQCPIIMIYKLFILPLQVLNDGSLSSGCCMVLQ